MPWPPQTRMQCLRQALEKEQILAQKGRILQSALRTAKIGKEKQKEKERNIEIFGTPFIIGKTIITNRKIKQKKSKNFVPKGEKGILYYIFTPSSHPLRYSVKVKFENSRYAIWNIWASLKNFRILEDDSETWWQKKYKDLSEIKQKSEEFRLLSIEKKKNKLLWDKKNKAICIEVKSKNWKEFLKGNTQKLVAVAIGMLILLLTIPRATPSGWALNFYNTVVKGQTSFVEILEGGIINKLLHK